MSDNTWLDDTDESIANPSILPQSFSHYNVSETPTRPQSQAEAFDVSIGNHRMASFADDEPMNEPTASDVADDISDDERDLFRSQIRELEKIGLVEIGGSAEWNASSFKEGFGMRELRKDDPNAFWQSDGVQPHYIDLIFPKRVPVERVSLFTNYTIDESYTPCKISVLAGTAENDLLEVATCEMMEPVGWSHIVFSSVRADGVLKAFYVRVKFISNHQNGKDTHLRCLKIFSPSVEQTTLLHPEFTSIKLLSESCIR